MAIRNLIAILATAALFLILLAGCQSAPNAYHGDISYGPAHALSMDSAAQHQFNRRSQGQAWYLGRNDTYPTVYYGAQVQTYTETDVYERDRQDITNGRARDHYSRTTVTRTHSRRSR